MMAITLGELLTRSGITSDKLTCKTPITRITANSSECTPGTLFVAVRGATKTSKDGHDFISAAAKRGACAAVVDKAYHPQNDGTLALIFVDDTKTALCHLAEAFHDFPSRTLKVIGITGTNGKTSTSFMLHSILKAAGFKPKIMGTLGAGDPHALQPLSHTTMDPLFISSYLAQLVRDDASHVIMEISSHALALKRAEALQFAAVALTNITQDHLDLHETLENYREAKARLFFALADRETIKVLPEDHPFASRVHEITAHYVNADEPVPLLPFFGDFHEKNARLARAIARAFGVSELAINQGLSTCPAIPGRLESIATRHNFRVFVDFAHTPHALTELITTLRKLPHERLIIVFGCGGDRDRDKRPLMGRAACEADIVIITDDNPRTEKPDDIRAQIRQGLTRDTEIYEIADRRHAITFALKNAQKNDLVVIAGKGHENYQIYGSTTVVFSDQEEARKVLATL